MGSEFEDEIFEGLRAAMNALKIKNTVVLSRQSLNFFSFNLSLSLSVSLSVSSLYLSVFPTCLCLFLSLSPLYFFVGLRTVMNALKIKTQWF